MNVENELVKIILNEAMSINGLAKKAGINEKTIRRWLDNNATPRIDMASYVLDVLGYELKIVKKEAKDNG